MDRLLGERKPLLEEALETEVGWKYYYGFLTPPPEPSSPLTHTSRRLISCHGFHWLKQAGIPWAGHSGKSSLQVLAHCATEQKDREGGT